LYKNITSSFQVIGNLFHYRKIYDQNVRRDQNPGLLEGFTAIHIPGTFCQVISITIQLFFLVFAPTGTPDTCFTR